jgi:peptidoglycan hydrolase FlgJ
VSGEIGPNRAEAFNPQSAEARLRRTAKQMEGVFVEQLFKAMRETVPEGGLVDGGAGEEVFTGMLDQHLAGEAPARWSRGLAESLYRQLRGQLGTDGAAAEAAPAPNTMEK